MIYIGVPKKCGKQEIGILRDELYGLCRLYIVTAVLICFIFFFSEKKEIKVMK